MKNKMMCAMLLYLMGTSATVKAQPDNTQSQLTLRRLNSLGVQSSVDQIAPESKVVGTPYLYDDWKTGTIVLETEQSLENFPLRFDIRLNRLEIKTDNDIKVLQGKKVKQFLWQHDGKTELYSTADQFRTEDGDLNGFVQILSSGTLTIVKHTTLVMKKPDYSVQFNVGSRDTELLKKETLYYTHDTELHELPKNNKKLLSLFGSQSQQVQQYIKANKLTFKDEEDLKKIFNYFNQLH